MLTVGAKIAPKRAIKEQKPKDVARISVGTDSTAHK